jgi:hypothetical protein
VDDEDKVIERQLAQQHDDYKKACKARYRRMMAWPRPTQHEPKPKPDINVAAYMLIYGNDGWASPERDAKKFIQKMSVLVAERDALSPAVRRWLARRLRAHANRESAEAQKHLDRVHNYNKLADQLERLRANDLNQRRITDDRGNPITKDVLQPSKETSDADIPAA